MNEPLTIKLKTVTPLWTGGADGTSDRLHATGIIGSLRWWYEALVRGLGGRVCDPIEHPCSLSGDNLKVYEQSIKDGKAVRQALSEAKICSVCQLFGATGWARRFRLVVEDRTAARGPDDTLQPTGSRFKKDGQQRPSWYFKGGRTGDIALRIIPATADFDPIVVLGTLSLIARWGGLAAKPQLGYGWIEVVSAPPFDVDEFVRGVQTTAAAHPAANNGLPSLDKMFFAQVQASDAGVTATLNLKYDLRAAFRNASGGGQTLRHWVCGSVRGEQRQASKISVTQAVNGAVRVWGWIPEDVPVRGVTRDQVVDKIKATLTAYGQLGYWREFNSARDTFHRQTDAPTYLLDLLQRS
jgi:CRISPR-associated protein Cmr1